MFRTPFEQHAENIIFSEYEKIKNKKHCSILTIDIARSLNNSTLTNEQLDTVSNVNETVSSEEYEEVEDLVTLIPIIRKQ